MAVKAKTRPPAAAKATNGAVHTAPVETVNLDQVAQSAERLINECSEVRLRVNWFTTTAKIDKATTAKMLGDTGATVKAVSMNKRIMSSTHESVQAVDAARKNLMDHRDAWTVPMLALSTTTGAVDEIRKEAGVRLIQKKDMAEFDERLQYLVGILKTTVARLQNDLDAVKEIDRAALGTLFNEEDYPKDLIKLVSVEISYRNVGVDLDWQKICPKIYEREQNIARDKFSAVVEGAAIGFAKEFVSYMEQAVQQLGCRVILNPRSGKEMIRVFMPKNGSADEFWQQEVDVSKAEILHKVTHEDDPDNVPKGKVSLKVRLYSGGRGSGRSTEVWAEPMTEEVLQTDLRPFEDTSQPRKVYGSTIDNMKSRMAAFLNIGEMMGPFKPIIENAVNEVRELLTSCSPNQDTEKIALEIRTGAYFRSKMKKTLITVVEELQTSMSDVKSKRRTLITGAAEL